MEPILRDDLDAGVVRLRLATGPRNPITPDLLLDLDNHLGDLETRPPRALVLDGGAGTLFSEGFDLPAVLAFNRREMLYFTRQFCDLLGRLVCLPAPTIAAVHGHALAAGFTLALACDFRAVQQGPLNLGWGHVEVGLSVPPAAQQLLAARTTPAASQRLALFGGMLSPDDAADLGLADLLADDAQRQALELAEVLARKPGQGVRVSKLYAARSLAEDMARAARWGRDAWLDTWFSEAAQTRLRALADRL